MVTRKADTPQRRANRKYEEKNKDKRREQSGNFQTMITLNDYTTSSSYSYSITDENILYAREQFNYVYEELLQVWTIE